MSAEHPKISELEAKLESLHNEFHGYYSLVIDSCFEDNVACRGAIQTAEMIDQVQHQLADLRLGL